MRTKEVLMISTPGDGKRKSVVGRLAITHPRQNYTIYNGNRMAFVKYSGEYNYLQCYAYRFIQLGYVK